MSFSSSALIGSSAPLSVASKARLYSAVELLRVADQLLDVMVDAADADENAIVGPGSLYAMQCRVRLFARLLQEHVGGVRPHLADRVFQRVTAHENRSPRHQAKIEATILALTLAGGALCNVLEAHPGDDRDDLYDAIFGIHDMVEGYSGSLETTTCGFGLQVYDVLAAITEDRPIPPDAHLRAAAIRRGVAQLDAIAG